MLKDVESHSIQSLLCTAQSFITSMWCDEKQNGLRGMSRDEGQPLHLIGLLCATLKMRLNG